MTDWLSVLFRWKHWSRCTVGWTDLLLC